MLRWGKIESQQEKAFRGASSKGLVCESHELLIQSANKPPRCENYHFESCEAGEKVFF
jgi:hypothetical protein